MQSFSGSLDMSVLICSPSHPLRQSLETVLSAMGCVTAASVGNAGEARQQAGAQHFDVAIVDEAFETGAGLDLPVVTLRSAPAATLSAREIAKPFRPAELARMLTAGRDALAAQAPAHAATP